MKKRLFIKIFSLKIITILGLISTSYTKLFIKKINKSGLIIKSGWILKKKDL